MLLAYNSAAAAPPPLVFLGLDESDTSSGFSHSEAASGVTYAGRPYFAAELPAWAPAAGGPVFRASRGGVELAPAQAAILAQARAVLDWHRRNRFCAACGAATVAIAAGMKRVCPATDGGVARGACVARAGVHNIAFPRTDPTVIMAVVSADGQRVLLGRNRRWPGGFVSCLAGFCEPAESVEEAVRRETYEEAGVRVGRVVVHSTQPWPFPNSLMLGCVAQALAGGEDINLGHDPELDTAEWLDLAFVRECLKGAGGDVDGRPRVRLPPSSAIAHQLLLAVVNNYHGGLKI